MIYGFVGSFQDNIYAPLRGNGKTISMTYFLNEARKKGLTVYTNYQTTFSNHKTTEEIANLIFSGDLQEAAIGIDEIQKIMENLGKNKYGEFMGELVNESRKDEVDIYFSTQRFYNLMRRFRLQVDRVLVPQKYHTDSGDFCDIDRCPRNHYIQVYFVLPYVPAPAISFSCAKIGNLYNTKGRVREMMKG